MDIKYLGIWSGDKVLSPQNQGNSPFWKMELLYKVWRITKEGFCDHEIAIPLKSSWSIDDYLKRNELEWTVSQS